MKIFDTKFECYLNGAWKLATILCPIGKVCCWGGIGEILHCKFFDERSFGSYMEKSEIKCSYKENSVRFIEDESR